MRKSTGRSYRKTDPRTIKAIATAMASFEEKTKKRIIPNYDFDHIGHYRCVGNELIGSSVIGFSAGTHFLAASREYEIYEFPSKANKPDDPRKGRFVVLFRDVLAGTWVLASLNYTCFIRKRKIKTGTFDEVIEKAEYELISESSMTMSGGSVFGHCETQFDFMTFTIPERLRKARFDPQHARLNSVYGHGYDWLLSKLGMKRV